MKLVAAVAALATTASLASAQPYDATETERKDPGVAIGLSVGGTAASLGLIAFGANLSDRAGGGLAVLGAMEALSHLCFGSFDNGTSTDPSCSRDASPDYFPATMLGLGAALAVGGTIYDIATAGSAAEHWNNTHHLALAPAVIPSTTGPTAGLSLGGVF